MKPFAYYGTSSEDKAAVLSWALGLGCSWQGPVLSKRSLHLWGISAEAMQGVWGTSGQMFPLCQCLVMHREE